MTDNSMLGPAAQSQIDSAATVHDSYLTAVLSTPVTVGMDWVQLTGFEVGPQNFDISTGPDLILVDEDGEPAHLGAATGAGISVGTKGRYFCSTNCQFQTATADGYFEGAIEPNGLSLADWPTDVEQGHDGRNVIAAVLGWDNVAPGFQIGYLPPQLSVGALITAWARYASASGDETIDITAILYVTRAAR